MAVMIDLHGSSANTENLLRIGYVPANRLKETVQFGPVLPSPPRGHVGPSVESFLEVCDDGWPCLKLLNLDLTVQDPLDIFKLVHYEAQTVGKWGVGI